MEISGVFSLKSEIIKRTDFNTKDSLNFGRCVIVLLEHLESFTIDRVRKMDKEERSLLTKIIVDLCCLGSGERLDHYTTEAGAQIILGIKSHTSAGIEPTLSCLPGERLDHYTTEAGASPVSI
ncbi:hypothetical protein M8J77_007766 [Diaphorina citri]|nr:hypothetical protein M8J77_007766 [Diaphorina citri]